MPLAPRYIADARAPQARQTSVPNDGSIRLRTSTADGFVEGAAEWIPTRGAWRPVFLVEQKRVLITLLPEREPTEVAPDAIFSVVGERHGGSTLILRGGRRLECIENWYEIWERLRALRVQLFPIPGVSRSSHGWPDL